MEYNFEYFQYLALCLKGFFFGLYSGIFVIYLQHYGSQHSTVRTKNILFYALWVLYALSAATSIIDILEFCWVDAVTIARQLEIIEYTVFACCDFIAQFILIYRCWIVWGYNIRAVIFPSFLAFAFLAIWIASGTAHLSIIQGKVYTSVWGGTLEVSGLALSMIVNALVTGLIVFKIFKVFQEVKTSTADDRILGVTGGSTLQRVIFILIESGMALLSIQLARLVIIIVRTNAANDAYYLVAAIHVILNGITPTIILVRVSMGLSFHDESSVVEASAGSFRVAPDDPNSIPETRIVDEERRHDDFDLQLTCSDDPDMYHNI